VGHWQQGDQERPSNQSGRSQVSSEALDGALAFLRKYFVYPDDETAWVHALYAAYTWQCWRFRHAPRLVIDSPERGSGKSVLAEDVLGGICNGLHYTADATPASIYQVIGDNREAVTIALDELDMVLVSRSADGNEQTRALMQLINTGYKKGGTVWRGGEKAKPVKYDVYRPMVLVGITFWSRLKAATQSRCIRTTLLKAKPTERIGTRQFEQERDGARADLWAWTTGGDSKRKLKLDPFAEVPYADAMDARTADTWTPLVAMAEAAGGAWPERVRQCIEKMAIEDDGAKVPAKAIVADTYSACHSHLLNEDRYPSGIPVTVLADALVRLGAPWDGTAGRDKLTDDRLKVLLRDYRVASKRVTHGPDKGRYRIMWRDLEAMWAAYLAPDDSDGEAAGTAPVVSLPIAPSPPSPPSPERTADVGFGGYSTTTAPGQQQVTKSKNSKLPEQLSPPPDMKFKGPLKSSAEWAAERGEAC